MSTTLQIASNRANARHSTGPKTEAGKLASSRNSFRHGLTAKQVVIPGEDPAEYDALRQEFHEDYAPANAAESVVVDLIAQHSWRLQRVRRAESATFERLMREDDTDAAMAGALVHPHGDLEKIRRYEVTIERSFHRAIEQLRKLQKDRRAEEKESRKLSLVFPNLAATDTERSARPAAGFVSQLPAAPVSQTEIGFVSQPAATGAAAVLQS
jgi:hypothetical protein